MVSIVLESQECDEAGESWGIPPRIMTRIVGVVQLYIMNK